ncbi:MAG: DeoR family transcriptional regulator [Rickettsiaceae bacterium]|nr:DeoR family transcriptional regulator [Rickettsiaceae bacterium]
MAKQNNNHLNQLSTLITKSQLNTIITNKDGTPDFLAINIYYDSLRSWYTPKQQYQSNGNVVQIKKLKTQGIYSRAEDLAKTHGVSKETIRKKIVKLEKLGLIQRSFKHKYHCATHTYNQRIIYVLQETPYFFNSYGCKM